MYTYGLSFISNPCRNYFSLYETYGFLFSSFKYQDKKRAGSLTALLADADIPNDRDLRKALHNKLRCRGKVVSVGPMKAYGGAGV
jgi:hypothetical protein